MATATATDEKKKSTKPQKKEEPKKRQRTRRSGTEAEKSVERTPDEKDTEPVPSPVVQEPISIESTCPACGIAYSNGFSVKCSCGKIVHRRCFEPHILAEHRPDHEVVMVHVEKIMDDSMNVIGMKATYTPYTG